MASISVPAAVIAGSTIADAVAAVTVTEAITAIGAVLSVAGVITGNKALSYAGMALGIVGGIGSLASSAGILGSAADPTMGNLFGPSTTDIANDAAAQNAAGYGVTAAGDQGGTLAAATTGTAPADAIQTATTPDIVDSMTGSVTANPLDVASPDGVSVSGAENPLDATSAAQSPDLDTVTGSPSGAGSAAGNTSTSALPPQSVQQSGTLPGSAAATPTPAAPDTPVAAAPAAPAAPGGVSADTKALLSGMNKNSMMQSVIGGVTQAGGALLSGLTNPVTPAQVTALNAQAAANQAATQLSLTQQANMAQAKPVATLGSPGIINSPTTGQAA